MIESSKNDLFKRLVRLTTSKGLKEEKLFILSGEKLVREFLQRPPLKIAYEVISPHHIAFGEAEETVTMSAELFAQLDVLGTHFNLLILAQPALQVLEIDDLRAYRPVGIELVVPTSDPGNLGALIRSCEAFGVSKIILTKESAHPFLPKSVRASAGSALRVPMLKGPALADFPETAIALDLTGTALDEFAWPENGLLVIGEEGPGFGKTQFPKRVFVPTRGVESLNVVVATSIALSRIPQRKLS